MRRWVGRMACAAVAAGTLVPAGAGIALAASQNVAFTVANYPVEARAKDAVAAKEKALADGQQAAFRSLLKRIVPVTAYDRLNRVSAVKAGDLIEGVAVRSERNSRTEYIASLDFSFQAEAVRGLLRRESVPFIDTLAPPVVLVPVLRDVQAGKAGPDRAWSKAWTDLDLEHTLTPLKVQALKPAIHADTLRMAGEGDGSALRILSSEYKSETVVLALADHDSSTGRLQVTMFGTDAVGPLYLKRSYPVASDDVRYTKELAAVFALGVRLLTRHIEVLGTADGPSRHARIALEPRGIGASYRGVSLVVRANELRARWCQGWRWSSTHLGPPRDLA